MFPAALQRTVFGKPLLHFRLIAQPEMGAITPACAGKSDLTF
jgi:hypothetical protein